MPGNDAAGSDRQGQNAAAPVLKTPRQAAAYTGLSERTIRRYIKAGKLGTVQIDGRELIQPEDLDRLAATDRHIQANAAGSDRQAPDPVAEALADTIRRQDSEITFLRTELTALRDSLNHALLMLPGAENKPARKWDWLFWLLLGGLILTALLMAYVVWRPAPIRWTGSPDAFLRVLTGKTQ